MELNIIEQNKELIERFVLLATGNDYQIDKRYKWFHSIFSRRDIELINYSAEDIRQDIIVFILEQYKGYRGKNFNLYLNLSISRYVRDKIKYDLKEISVCAEYNYNDETNIDCFVSCDLHWIFKQDRIPLTDYERYILYLSLDKEYSINQICDITYQDRKSVRNSLITAKEIIRKELF